MKEEFVDRMVTFPFGPRWTIEGAAALFDAIEQYLPDDISEVDIHALRCQEFLEVPKEISDRVARSGLRVVAETDETLILELC